MVSAQPADRRPRGHRDHPLIQDRANELLASGAERVRRVPSSGQGRPRRRTPTTTRDTWAILARGRHGRRSRHGLRIGVDPLGGASLAFWHAISEKYGLGIEVVNDEIDPAFGGVPVDWDGRIRMDCSSPHAMARLIALKDRFDVAFGNDPDADRHGIVTRTGLMNPNHYLAAAIFYLFTHRAGWRDDAGVGKTVVSSSIIDRVARKVGRSLVEVPVGFKWFVPGLLDGSLDRRRGERGRIVPSLRRHRLVDRQGRESSSRSWPSR